MEGTSAVCQLPIFESPAARRPGTGSRRQRWITYRDALGYDIRTRRGPLYPFNSLKFQSVFYAQLSLAKNFTTGPQDLVDDIHMAAGGHAAPGVLHHRAPDDTRSLLEAVPAGPK